MEWKLLLTVFGAVFVAEIVDKTQLVTLSVIAGSGFMLIGAWTLYHGLTSVQ